jgi:hypothetical protein
MTTTLLRGRLQVRVLPGSPEKPIDFNTYAASAGDAGRASCTILHERDKNARFGAYKSRTGRSRSVAEGGAPGRSPRNPCQTVGCGASEQVQPAPQINGLRGVLFRGFARLEAREEVSP